MYLLVTFQAKGPLISNTMATQQQQRAPSRPWFRLATMVRPPTDQAPPPPRPPPAAATFIRPAFTTQVPPPPPPRATVPPPPLPRATVPPPRATVPPPTRATRPSPIISPPPSPLRLPSPQHEQKKLETKQKPNLVVETPKKINSDSDANHHHHNHDVRMMRIITIAGVNKGAIMELTPLKKDDDTPSSDDGKKMNAIMNSNVQGVNNSILFNCSTSHHDPGVHLSLSRKQQRDHE